MEQLPLFGGMDTPPPAASDSATAVIVDAGTHRYRYVLTRGEPPYALFCGLNPSTADATQDDPTIRRCLGFAERFGCSGLIMVNLFAFMATDPGDLRTAGKRGVDVVGPENDRHLAEYAAKAKVRIAAWGSSVNFARGAFLWAHGRDFAAWQALVEHGPVHALGVTLGGQPRHPLYLSADAPLRDFSPRVS